MNADTQFAGRIYPYQDHRGRWMAGIVPIKHGETFAHVMPLQRLLKLLRGA